MSKIKLLTTKNAPIKHPLILYVFKRRTDPVNHAETKKKNANVANTRPRYILSIFFFFIKLG